MRFVRRSVGFVSVFALLAGATDIAHAQEPAQPAAPPPAAPLPAPDEGTRLDDTQLDRANAPPAGRLTLPPSPTPQGGPTAFSPRQNIAVTAVPPSKDAWLGIVLVSAGSIAVVVGLFVIVENFATAATQCSASAVTPTSCPGPAAGPDIVGVATLVAAAGAIVGGALVLHFGGKSSQRQAVSDLILPKTPVRPDTVWLRAPVWRDSVGDGVTGAARVGVPILSRSF
jgi:hypothetical protein